LRPKHAAGQPVLVAARRGRRPRRARRRQHRTSGTVDVIAFARCVCGPFCGTLRLARAFRHTRRDSIVWMVALNDKEQPNVSKGTEVTRRDGFVLFWSGWPSNWHRAPFVVDGQPYNCGEQWMMAEKARTFRDEATLAATMAAS